MTSKIPLSSYVLIVGAMKAGTTSLYNYLIQHPQICECRTKEPEFFSENQEHGIEVENYEDLFNFNPNVHKIALEASTGYTKYPFEKNVPKNIKAYGLLPKFIYLVRNPFERIESQFNHIYKDDSSFTFDSMYKYLIDYSKYATQLKEFESQFSITDILILDFEELKNKPNKVLKKVYDFIGLEEFFFPDTNVIFNKTTMKSKKIKVLLNKVDRKLHFLPTFTRQIIKFFLKKIYKVSPLNLSIKQKQKIYLDLKDDMELLENKYGIDTKKWGF